MLQILGDPNLRLIQQALNEKRERLLKVGITDWTELVNGVGRNSFERLTVEIMASGDASATFQDVLEDVLSEMFSDPGKANPEGWVKTFLGKTEDLNGVWLMFVKSRMGQLMQKRMDEANIADQSLRTAIETHFLPWLITCIQSVLQRINLETATIFSFADVVPELEKQRKNLRKNPLPRTPDAQSGAGAPPTSKRSRKS